MTDELNWMPASKDFIEADVIRWIEAIWSDKKRGRGKNARNVLIGKQQVTGQVTKIDDKFVHVKVIGAVMIEKDGAKPSHLRIEGTIIRKMPATLLKGELERLPWSDEENRAHILREKK